MLNRLVIVERESLNGRIIMGQWTGYYVHGHVEPD